MLENGAILLRFAYHSLACSEITRDQLRRIAQNSWKHNLNAKVFGLLEYRDGRFSQVIEARRNVMNVLVPAILSDPRHQMIDITAFETIEERTFSRWSFTGFEDLDLGDQLVVDDRHDHSNVVFIDRFGTRAGARCSPSAPNPSAIRQIRTPDAFNLTSSVYCAS